MDIYNFAEQYNYGTDYYDYNTGYTYGIQEYDRILKELNVDKEAHHLTDAERKQYQKIADSGIPVYCGTVLIGYARKDMKWKK